MSNSYELADNHFKESATTEEIHSKLNDQLEAVLYQLLPNGKIINNQFIVGNTCGDKGESLKVELLGSKAGLWQDFATGEGGDILDLWGAVKGIDSKTEFPKLIEDINNWLDMKMPFQNSVKSLELTASTSVTNKIANNDNIGKPIAEWSYLDEQGDVIAKVFRYDTENGKKYLPWDKKLKKHKMPNPRPLYNLPDIITTDRVILVEGEKCAQSLIDIGICATTAMGGAKALVDKTDWSPLKGKNIIIWPDNDEPGKSYAQSAYEKLIKIGAKSVKIIDIPADKPEKWDAADAIGEMVNVKEFIEQAKFLDIAADSKNNTDNIKIKSINPKDFIGIPPEREWIIPDWLPKGCVTAVYGDGGVGKSLLIQQLMTSVATGREWLGYTTKPMRVYGLLCEDDEKEIWYRQYNINKQLGIEMSELDNIKYVSRVGEDNLLMTFGDKDVGKLTSFFSLLEKDIEEFKPDLVVLDTAADIFGGYENNRTHVRQFIQNCCAKIARDANAAVLICAHPSDSGLQRKTGTGGSTAWNNTVRSRWYFEWVEDDNAPVGLRELSLKKSNYSASKTKLYLSWNNGIFSIDDNYNQLSGIERRTTKWDDARDARSNEILNLIYDSASAGQAYTMGQFAENFEGTGTKFGLGSKRTIQNRLDNLATRGFIKFFQNGEDYGLAKLPRSKFGYMCIRNMNFNVKGKGSVFIKPTHYKCRHSGAIQEEVNPKNWVYHFTH